MRFRVLLCAAIATVCAASVPALPPKGTQRPGEHPSPEAIEAAKPRPGTVEAHRTEGFQRLLDAVVRLDVWTIDFRGGAERTSRGVGSGVIIREDGYILTNAHVVNPYAERIRVTLNSLENVEAEFVGWDHWTDLAVVRMDMEDVAERGLNFSHALFGDSDALAPGDVVFAVGTPNGLTRTVTRGIISNTSRYFHGREVSGGYETGDFNTWLQTDAAINPGNSGGPLVTPGGGVIGINTRAYLGANNLAFAVPGVIAEAVTETLIADGEVTRSYIGITPGPLQDLESFFKLEANRGMLVESVDPGSPAAEAGVTAGDIVLAIAGKDVDGRFPEQLPGILNAIAARDVGTEVVLTLKRGGQTEDVAITTEALESRVGDKRAYEVWGISVQEISKAVAREEKLNSADGVRIIGTQAGYPADEADLRRGDILTGINREPLVGLEDLSAAYEAYVDTPEKVFLEIFRNGSTAFKILKPQE